MGKEKKKAREFFRAKNYTLRPVPFK